MEQTVLVIEDDVQVARSLGRLAKTCGLTSVSTSTVKETRSRIRERWSAVIADVWLSDGSVLDLLEE